MELEFALNNNQTDESYCIAVLGPSSYITHPISQIQGGTTSLLVDWEPMVRSILEDLRERVSVGHISAKFHNAMVEAAVSVAKTVGEESIVLTGGCFQNKYLTERAIYRLRQEGFRPYWHQRIPPNDGGIALGQVVAAARSTRQFYRGGSSEQLASELLPSATAGRMGRLTSFTSMGG